MNLNTIENNNANGIRLIEQVNAGTDLRALSGTWTQNTITGNKGSGIELNGLTNGLIIGSATDTTFASANIISSNSQNGIQVTGAGNLTIGNNVIETNGTIGNLNTAAENAGILMNVAPFSNITVVNNLIANNLGDGVQYQISTGFNGFSSAVSINNNMIENNSGRGINMINRTNNFLQADISNNTVSGNKLEGVYIVNTASADQTIWASSTTPLLADGNVGASPALQLHMVNNEITGNGFSSGLQGTGLVIRVGTSGGGYGPNNPGGFASTGTSGAIIGQGASAATFFANVSSSNGGVIAQIDNNTLGGNFGNDIVFDSYVSTVNPIVTAGTWSPTQFTVTAFQGDPLSRFDLYFRGNTTDAGSADLVGSSLGGFAARNPALVAFYNNAEPQFKSNINTNTPAGPFTPQSATRARNATREAAFIPNFNTPAGPHILYPGLGPSTWRVSTNSVDNTTFFFNGFNVDTAPYVNTNDATGTFLNGIGNNGELPYGYGSF